MPVIGLVDPRSPDAMADRLRAFRQGLKDAGFVESENVAIDYRWAYNQLERLPVLLSDLIQRRVAVIAAPGGGQMLHWRLRRHRNDPHHFSRWRRPGQAWSRCEPRPSTR